MRVGETVDINWWRWIGDAGLAVGLGTQQAIEGDEIYVTRIAGVSADMTKVNRVDGGRSGVRADDVIWAANDGSPRILLAKQTGIDSMDQLYPSVFDVNLSTGAVRRMLSGRANVWNWYADGAGVIRMDLRTDAAAGLRELLYRANAKRRSARSRRNGAGRRTDSPPPSPSAPTVARSPSPTTTAATPRTRCHCPT